MSQPTTIKNLDELDAVQIFAGFSSAGALMGECCKIQCGLWV